jgi:hypothetical protein
MSWKAVKTQVGSFASSAAPGSSGAARHVILVSNDLTTVPDNFLDKIDNGHGCFYALNGEAFAMAAGPRATIVKPNGLGDGAAGAQELVVAHDDEGWTPTDRNYEFIARADVARLLAYAATHPDETAGLRFDVTAKQDGKTPTTDVASVFQAALFPWDPRKK